MVIPIATGESASQGGLIRGPRETTTVTIRTNANGLREYWSDDGKYWVPVITPEQAKRWAARG